MTARQVFAPDPAAVTAARRFVLSAAGDLPARQRDAVAVITSELAMNAVQHAGTSFEVLVEVSDSKVRVEVSDAGQGRPLVRQPPATTAHGRGLLLTEAMSDGWGVTPAPGATGSTVWFEISTAASPRAAGKPGAATKTRS